jgi:hypothetical protein
VEKERMQQHNECTHEKSAAAALYDRCASSIFAYARLFTPLSEDAEDVTLEVFTAALEWEHFSTLTERQQLIQSRCREGLRYAEIALLLNKREVIVRKLCSRTIALFRTFGLAVSAVPRDV